VADDCVSATTVIDAPAEAVFAVLADPARHAAIDGTGWVCDALDRQALTAAGQIFRISCIRASTPERVPRGKVTGDGQLGWGQLGVGIHRSFAFNGHAVGSNCHQHCRRCQFRPFPGRSAITSGEMVRERWEPEDLVGAWTLLEDDLRWVANKTGASRLGFGLLLKFFEQEGRFPRGLEELPV
jgi:hypothetical protein